jgi:hypothetical protein
MKLSPIFDRYYMLLVSQRLSKDSPAVSFYIVEYFDAKNEGSKVVKKEARSFLKNLCSFAPLRQSF